MNETERGEFLSGGRPEPSPPQEPDQKRPSPPGKPNLVNGATRNGLLGDLTLRHPWDIPLFAVGALITVVVYILWFAAVVFLIYMVATGQWGTEIPAESNAASDSGSFERSLQELVIQIFIIAGIMPWAIWIIRALMYAQMRANGVRMTPTQFPEGYRMVAEAAAQFGMRRVPDAYVVSGNGLINAFAAGHGFRRFVVVYSDLFEVGGKVRDPEALRFVIAHEVGHHAAGHTGYFRLLLSNLMMQIPVLGKALSRAQEYSADNYGYAHVPTGAPGTMALLSAGKYLNAHVNVHEMADRAATEKGFWVHLVNLTQTHPILTWRAHALRDRSRPGRLFLRPKSRVFEPMLPSGYSFSGSYPTPEEALALLDRAKDQGNVVAEEQFGRFPFGQHYEQPEHMREFHVRAPSSEARTPLVSRKPFTDR